MRYNHEVRPIQQQSTRLQSQGSYSSQSPVKVRPISYSKVSLTEKDIIQLTSSQNISSMQHQLQQQNQQYELKNNNNYYIGQQTSQNNIHNTTQPKQIGSMQHQRYLSNSALKYSIPNNYVVNNHQTNPMIQIKGNQDNLNKSPYKSINNNNRINQTIQSYVQIKQTSPNKSIYTNDLIKNYVPVKLENSNWIPHSFKQMPTNSLVDTNQQYQSSSTSNFYHSQKQITEQKVPQNSQEIFLQCQEVIQQSKQLLNQKSTSPIRQKQLKSQDDGEVIQQSKYLINQKSTSPIRQKQEKSQDNGEIIQQSKYLINQKSTSPIRKKQEKSQDDGETFSKQSSQILQSTNQSSLHIIQKVEIPNVPSDNPYTSYQAAEFNKKYPGYVIERKLGQGKFSQVFLACQKLTNFQVALKVIKKKLIIEKKMQDQLAWEIKIQLLLQHPNIVKLYTFFQNEYEIVLVLEHCGDGQLFEVIKTKKNGRLLEMEAMKYMKQVTSAISFLHSNDVIHRDIKPENVLLSFGEAKLADFSFCIYSPSQTRQTQCGSMVYSSPELVNGQAYDKSSDIWALGVLAYELCEGQTPWEDRNTQDTISLITKAQIICPEYFSKKLQNFIEMLTKKEPKDRLKARQAVSHPWLTFITDKPSVLMDNFQL